MKVNVAEKFEKISKHYNPKIVGELNGQYVKLVKFQGPFIWHKHDNEDEMFLVTRGSFRMEFRDHNEDIHDRGKDLCVDLLGFQILLGLRGFLRKDGCGNAR